MHLWQCTQQLLQKRTKVHYFQSPLNQGLLNQEFNVICPNLQCKIISCMHPTCLICNFLAVCLPRTVVNPKICLLIQNPHVCSNFRSILLSLWQTSPISDSFKSSISFLFSLFVDAFSFCCYVFQGCVKVISDSMPKKGQISWASGGFSFTGGRVNTVPNHTESNHNQLAKT